MGSRELLDLSLDEMNELRKAGKETKVEIPGSPFDGMRLLDKNGKEYKRMKKAVSDFYANFSPEHVFNVTRMIEAETEEDMKGKGQFDTVFNFALNTAESVPELTPNMLTVDDFGIRGASDTKQIEEKYLRGAAIGYSEALNGLSATYRCNFISVKAQPYNESTTIAHFDLNQSEYGRVLAIPNGGDNMLKIRHRVEFRLTGQFVDNLDGRWHLVVLNGVYRLATKKLANRYKGIQFNDAEDHSFIFKYGFVREDLISGLVVRPEWQSREIWIPYVEIDFPFKSKIKYLDPIAVGYTHEAIYETGGEFEKFRRRIFAGKQQPQYFDYDYEYRYNAENGISFAYMLIPRWRNYETRNIDVPLYPLSVPRVQPYYNHGNTRYIQDVLSDIVEPETETSGSSGKVLTYAAAAAIALWKLL